MSRPASIIRFERLWWGATAAWLVGTVLAWTRVERTLAANPQTAEATGIAQPIIVLLTIAVTALLWWLVARRASPTGKWLVVAVAAISGIQFLARLAGPLFGRSVFPLSLIAFLAGGALTVWAATLLFKPEADEWFGLGEPEELP